ncbi:MAG TPA: ABC transporter permease [Vicinamibacterales bacterium]
MTIRDALASLERDLRYAVRALGRTPGFTVVAVASLTIGLALTAVTGAAVNAYLVEPLPYADAERLYRVRYAPPGPWEPRGMSSLDWGSVADVVAYPITSSGETFYLAARGPAQAVRGLRVGRGFIEGLGVRAALGRTLEPVDFDPAGEQPAMIGHTLWRDRYGADPGVIGRIIRLETESGGTEVERLRVVGVLPPDFYFGRDSSERPDVLLPLMSPARTYMVRLQTGVPAEAAERRITDAARRVATDLPPDWSGVQLESVRELYVAQIRPVLMGVAAGCALVLLIVCANLTVLMLLRAIRRQGEFAVRVALGATRWDLTRVLLLEAGCLSLVAIALALAVAIPAASVLAPLIELRLGRPAPGGESAIAIHVGVLLIVAGIGLILAAVVSLLPAAIPWQRLQAWMMRRDRWTDPAGRPMRHVRSTLIALEVAGTLVLLVASGLVMSATIGMLRTDLGFEPDRLVRARVVLRASDYPDAEAFSRFYRQFADQLDGMLHAPVTFTSWPPFVELPTEMVEAVGQAGQGLPAGVLSVSEGYFATFGIELRSGRDFSDRDTTGADAVAAVSETLARRLWPDGAALGRQVRVIERTPEGPRAGPRRTVVAIAADVRHTYGDAALSDVYVPALPSGRFGSFYVRTDRSLAVILPQLRAAAAAIDPRATIDLPRFVASENRQLAGVRFLSMLLGSFAAVATFLALLGTYGVTAYATAQRERETAIRIALGAPSAAVVRLFLAEGSRVLGAGVAVGLLGAIAAARSLESQVVGVSAFDLGTLLPIAGAFAIVAAMAMWWPARRASRRNPLDALKRS